MEPEDIEIPEIKFKTNIETKKRRIKVVKDQILDIIGLIDTKNNHIMMLPEDEIDEILEDIKNLR